MPATSATKDVVAQLLQDPQSVPELRPFPAVASRVLAACRDPGTPLRQLASIIECDLAYASRLLRIANSSLYGFSGKIRTIRQALVVLGMRQVRNLALTLAGAEMLSTGDTTESATALWEHSLGCATVTKVLAGLTNAVEPEEAFLAGIFHDAGKRILLDLFPEDYGALLAEHNGEELCRIEQERYGASHAQIGRQCAEYWGLPAEVTRAIGLHHESEAICFSEPDTASSVAIANRLCRFWLLDPASSSVTEEEAAELAATLKLDDADIDNVRQQAMAMFIDLKQACA